MIDYNGNDNEKIDHIHKAFTRTLTQTYTETSFEAQFIKS